mmetsp:Transcript_14551/g.24660  ORF Transcript_14551/g.24660 Transcript_14551/m.24660 type:complete len:206 (-) Transcript_14551:490-1107(-)
MPRAYSSTLEVAACSGSGSCLVSFFAVSRSSRRGREDCRRARVEERPPTGSCCCLLYCVGSDTCWLSLRITIMLESMKPAWFMASYAMPPVMAPSPITAITWLSFPFRSRPTAMPSPAEMEVELWPAPKGSYSLSARLVKGVSPLVMRSVFMFSRRPVRILCGYDWWPTSQITLSSGRSNTLCSATVSSTTPRLEPRWPPVLHTL